MHTKSLDIRVETKPGKTGLEWSQGLEIEGLNWATCRPVIGDQASDYYSSQWL